MLDTQCLQKKTAEELIQIIVALDANLALLQARLDLLLSRQYKPKSEQMGQAELQFDEPDVSPEQTQIIEQAEEEITIPAHQRSVKKTGRQPIPAHLPRRSVIHDIADADKKCRCCGEEKACIDEAITEQIAYVPAKAYVLQHIRKKYACRNKHCLKPEINLAAMPKQPIPKSLSTPSLLAQILVSKYCYHMPLYRQEAILQDAGIDIPRATTSLWVIKCAKLLQPLVNLLQDNILDYDVAYADETRVQVLKETSRHADQPSFMWSFSGGTPDKFSTVFQYSPTRDHTVPLTFFGIDYAGYLHCDGYSAYETMTAKNKAVLVGCMIHARRKFIDIAKAHRNKKAGLAHEAIKIFKKLATIEQRIKQEKLDEAHTKAYRQAYAKPILDQFKSWLDEKITQVPPKFPIHQAIQYTINQWPKLIKYLDDGRLDWTNNLSERMMKAFATGRKNWLFSNSVQGAHASSVIYSLVATCNHHGINVFEYFRHVLKKIPYCQTLNDFERLLPYHVVLDNLDSS